jgi:hypothetical protein
MSHLLVEKSGEHDVSPAMTRTKTGEQVSTSSGIGS